MKIQAVNFGSSQIKSKPQVKQQNNSLKNVSLPSYKQSIAFGMPLFKQENYEKIIDHRHKDQINSFYNEFKQNEYKNETIANIKRFEKDNSIKNNAFLNLILTKQNDSKQNLLQLSLLNNDISLAEIIIGELNEKNCTKELLKNTDVEGHNSLQHAVFTQDIDLLEKVIDLSKENGILEKLLLNPNTSGFNSLQNAIFVQNVDAVELILKAAEEEDCLIDLLNNRNKPGYDALDLSSELLATTTEKQTFKKTNELIKDTVLDSIVKEKTTKSDAFELLYLIEDIIPQDEFNLYETAIRKSTDA